MQTLWFILVAFMLTVYVVLDGFDLGAGITHLLVAKTEDERRSILRAIGPFWDGNEVWLIAAGGTIFFAFPLLYASSFSGFYLSLHLVLWLLIFRAIGIEFRAHVDVPVWREFFDGLFFFGSALLAIVLGVALGNVIRGVPLGEDGYFFLPLWSDLKPGPNPGILDWYTVMAGLIAFIALATHGAIYVALKTEGDLSRRSRSVGMALFPVLVVLSVAGLIATIRVRPEVLNNYRAHPVGFVIPIIVVASLGYLLYSLRARQDFRAFMASSCYLAGMLGGAAFALYPTLLPASTNPARSLTIHNSAAGPYSLSGGLIWWGAGMALAIGYFVFVYRMFRGKVSIGNGAHGY
jgi:cytochrome d ubiquinol oxidase subunit II